MTVPHSLPSLTHPDAIPAELKDLPNWVCWRYEERGGRPTKVPYSPYGTPGKSNDASTWGSFEQALRRAEQGRMQGVGFQFSGTTLTGVDLDWKTYPGEGIPPEAERVIEALDSYTEITPSGKGAHIILRGKLPEGTKKRVQLSEYTEMEVYSEGRYFTVTGDVIQSPFVEDRQEALDALAKRWLDRESTRKSGGTSTSLPGAFTGTDNELWQRMFGAANGAKLRALADGDMSAYGGDHSRADFALVNHLCYWCNGDASRIDAMFRQSGLMRPKWDTVHSSDGQTYGQMTVQEALSRWDGRGYVPSVTLRSRPTIQWSDPEVLLRGRQHLASSGSHARTVDSYATLWHAVVHAVTVGMVTQDGDTLTLTPSGMTEVYAVAGGRLMDRRQQLGFLQAQGMVGRLVRQDDSNPRSPWLLQLPANPATLGMWRARECLQAGD